MWLNKFLIACGVLGTPIFLLSLFIFGLMYPGYDHFNQPISLLGALDSPVKNFANIFVFNLFGIFIILFSFGVFKSSEVRTVGKIGAFFFFVAGIVMFLVGIFPCDAGCNNFSITGDLHEKFSFYPFPIMTIGFLFFVFDILTNKKLWWLIFPIIIVGPISLVLRYLTTQFPYVYYFGILQRAAITFPFLIMMMIAMALYRVETRKGLFLFFIAITIAITGAIGIYLNGDSSSRQSGIPYLCSDEKACEDFCLNNRGRCEITCNKYPTNLVCQRIF